MVVSDTSLRLFRDIKNLILSNRLLPVEGYEFPQGTVAGFWKEVFEAKGIKVFGTSEVPEGISTIQVDFNLPEEPPDWLVET